MQLFDKISLSNDVNSYFIEDELLLFNQRTAQLFYLNNTATFIWKGLDQGYTTQELIQTIAHATGNPANLLEQDISDLLDKWYTLGLIGESGTIDQDKLGVEDLDLLEFKLDKHETFPKPSPNNRRIRFSIIGTRIQLTVPSKIELSRIEPILSHLKKENSDEYDLNLRIVQTHKRYVLLREEKPIDWCEDIAGIGPMVHSNTTVIAYEQTNCFLGLHAAAVGYQEKGILIPAVSGSGKSTLTAALIGSDFEYCADDLVLLSEPPIQMCTVPIAIGLKPGSWEPIQAFHPNIRSLSTHLRVDGKKVRYLNPPLLNGKHFDSKILSIDYILFPQFVETMEQVSFQTISAGEGLCKLTEAGYDLPGQLGDEKIRQLIEWIVSIPIYAIRFNSLTDARAQVIKLMG